MSIDGNNPLQQISQSKAEGKELFLQSEPDLLFEGYFDEIRNQSFRLRTEKDMEKVVSLELSGEPLTPLTKDELAKLEEYLKKNTQDYIYSLNTRYSRLAENQIYLVDNKLIEKKEDNKNNSPIKSEELINLLKNFEFLNSTRYISSHTSGGSLDMGLLNEGSRYLYARAPDEIAWSNHYGYMSQEDFRKKLDIIKQRTKKNILTMLDIGGNVGSAVIDAKNIDSTLKTINMTLTHTPVTFGDVVIRHPAEYMPAILEENVDLIESNYAFRYFIFPDVSLQNAVKALSIGGETNIAFTNDYCDLEKEELFERMKKVFAWLQHLEQEGYIEVTRQNGSDPFLVEKPYFGRQLQIIKKKSIKGL